VAVNGVDALPSEHDAVAVAEVEEILEKHCDEKMVLLLPPLLLLQCPLQNSKPSRYRYS
jgi:hypothetical protein